MLPGDIVDLYERQRLTKASVGVTIIWENHNHPHNGRPTGRNSRPDKFKFNLLQPWFRENARLYTVRTSVYPYIGFS